MKSVIFACLLLAAPVSALQAQDMLLSDYLARSEALGKKGSAAMHSNEYSRLKRQLDDSRLAVIADERAAKKAGQPQASCVPRHTNATSSKELFDHFRSIPASSNMTVKDAFADLMKKKYPCAASGT